MMTILDPSSRRDYLLPVLGLFPLLAVAVSLKAALTISVVCIISIVVVNGLVSATRHLWPLSLQLTVILLVNAAMVSLAQMFLQFCCYEISLILGIYIPLLAMNCLMIAWAEEYSLRHGMVDSVVNGLKAGLVLLLLLTVTGFIREHSGLVLLQEPFGAFCMLALMAALFNVIHICGQSAAG